MKCCVQGQSGVRDDGAAFRPLPITGNYTLEDGVSAYLRPTTPWVALSSIPDRHARCSAPQLIQESTSGRGRACPGGTQGSFALRVRGDYAVVVTDSATDAHTGAPHGFP